MAARPPTNLGLYENEAEDEDLASWLYSYLGNTSDGKGFGYDDVLVDADAWLIAHYMKTHPSGASLSDAMLDVFKHSETNRIKRFYQERFAANADNVVSVFRNSLMVSISGSSKTSTMERKNCLAHQGPVDFRIVENLKRLPALTPHS